MRRIFIMLIVVIVINALGITSAFSLENKSPKILLIPREGPWGDIELMITKEAGVMISMLEESGFIVKIASASGQDFVGPKTTLKSDMKLAEVEPSNYAGLIMSCMSSPDDLPIPPEATEIVDQLVKSGKPVAAQYGSVFILAEAGVLAGRRYAMCYDAGFADAIYVGNGVVQDGNIITSGICPLMSVWGGLPDGTAKLTQTLINELAYLLAVEPTGKLSVTGGNIKSKQ